MSRFRPASLNLLAELQDRLGDRPNLFIAARSCCRASVSHRVAVMYLRNGNGIEIETLSGGSSMALPPMHPY